VASCSAAERLRMICSGFGGACVSLGFSWPSLAIGKLLIRNWFSFLGPRQLIKRKMTSMMIETDVWLIDDNSPRSILGRNSIQHDIVEAIAERNFKSD